MANAIRKDVEELTQKELEVANEKFPLFSSNHEAYAVLLEEVEESKDDIEFLEHMMHGLWRQIKNNSLGKDSMECVKRCAIDLACEAIQAAAMAQKAIDSEERRNKDND